MCQIYGAPEGTRNILVIIMIINQIGYHYDQINWVNRWSAPRLKQTEKLSNKIFSEKLSAWRIKTKLGITDESAYTEYMGIPGVSMPTIHVRSVRDVRVTLDTQWPWEIAGYLNVVRPHARCLPGEHRAPNKGTQPTRVITPISIRLSSPKYLHDPAFFSSNHSIEFHSVQVYWPTDVTKLSPIKELFSVVKIFCLQVPGSRTFLVLSLEYIIDSSLYWFIAIDHDDGL